MAGIIKERRACNKVITYKDVVYLVTLLITVGGPFSYFYYSTKEHIEDTNIHFVDGEKAVMNEFMKNKTAHPNLNPDFMDRPTQNRETQRVADDIIQKMDAIQKQINKRLDKIDARLYRLEQKK